MHDFEKFPELTNAQMELYYFESPHKQITQDFWAKCVKVTDGDTIRVRWSERDFDFPVRLAETNAPELSENGGAESKSWLENKILNDEVYIAVTKTRVDKWGRLLAKVYAHGTNISDEMIIAGKAVAWANKNDGKIIDEIKLPKEFN